MSDTRRTPSPPTHTLFSHGLLSKWGFGDGDEPEGLWDYRDETGYQWQSDWHDILRRLVRRHLLPALDQTVEVFDISTIHNPIRARTVNGVEIDHCANYPDDFLTPEAVEVTWEQIVAADVIAPASTPSGRSA